MSPHAGRADSGKMGPFPFTVPHLWHGARSKTGEVIGRWATPPLSPALLSFCCFYTRLDREPPGGGDRDCVAYVIVSSPLPDTAAGA